MIENESGNRARQAQILVVDDDTTIGAVLCEGLSLSHCMCFAVVSAAQAIEYLENNPVDIVITDIRMDGMDGIELCEIIKKRFNADVIVMTGMVQDFTYDEIIGRGASDFIEKPLGISEVVARVKRILLERATLNEKNKAVAALEKNLKTSRIAMEGFVQAISLVVEMRDPYTAGHQQRVGDLACAIAQALRMPRHQIDGLKMASVIHDLGKITIPSEILCKPGSLNKIEHELIRNHVQAGYDILKKIEFPWPLADIILQHHERIDGSGYPNGLKGDEIMAEAKILSVSDVFETIASHRPYRPSLGMHAAMAELIQNKGIRYDAAIAETCVRLIDEKEFRFENNNNKKSGFVTSQMQHR